jgi:hypothetical protein
MYAAYTLISYYRMLPKSVLWNEVSAEVDADDMRRSDAPLPEAPHVVLANIGADTKSLVHFVKQYGLPYHDVTFARGQGWEKGMESSYRIYSYRIYWSELRTMQDLLRRAWEGDAEALDAMQRGISHSATKALSLPLRLVPEFSAKGIHLRAPDLWSYMRICFLSDLAVGKARVCENKDCNTKYFVQHRKGQQYCCNTCAVLMAVHRYRSRQREGLRLLRRAETSKGTHSRKSRRRERSTA